MSSGLWSSRRAILVNGLRAFLVSVLGWRLGGTVVSAQQTLKARSPRLLDDAFNKRFVPLRGSAQFAAEMAELKKDLVGYLSTHFELTPAQLRAVKALPAADVQALNAAVDRAVSEKLAFKLKGVGARTSCGRMRSQISGGTLTIEISGS